MPENRELSYMTVTKLAQPGDFVVVEFSHNDGQSRVTMAGPIALTPEM